MFKYYFLIITGFFIKSNDAQNCMFAPICPTFNIWIPGYVCPDGFYAHIRNRFLNGVKTKTICCADLEGCTSNYSCPAQYNNGNFYPDINTSQCSNGCIIEWKKYTGDLSPTIDGFSVSSNVYLGRTQFFNGYQIGKIEAGVQGIKIIYGGSELSTTISVEYLVANPSYNFLWVPSSNGSLVENAITINIPRSSSQYIGRNSLLIGPVVRNMGGLFYSDANGIVDFTNTYDVLTCKLTPVNITSQPQCPVQWKSKMPGETIVTYSFPIVNSSLPTIIQSNNGIIVGDYYHSYQWINIASITSSSILVTLTLPGGVQTNIGRIIVDGVTIIGSVDVQTFNMEYVDDYGVTKVVICYEVLSCVDPYAPTTTTTTQSSTLPNVSTSTSIPLTTSTDLFTTTNTTPVSSSIPDTTTPQPLTSTTLGQATTSSLDQTTTVPATTTTFVSSTDSTTTIFLNLTTASTPTIQTTTTISELPKTCDIVWLPYDGVTDVSQLSVFAGSIGGLGETYVGRADVYGNLLAGRIDKISSTSYCYHYGEEPCITSFDYLFDNTQYTYQWISSQNGDYVFGAINVDGFYVARISSGVNLYLATVVPSYGIVYYDDSENTWQYTNVNYEVLTCNPYPSPVTFYDCAQVWNPYLLDTAPTVDGIFIEKDIFPSSDFYIGRIVSNNNYVFGKVRVSNPPGILYYQNGVENFQTTEIEYLVLNPGNLYKWISSSNGQAVPHAFQIQYSSAQWPAIIGRVLINSTYVLFGSVIQGKGLVVTDVNNMEQIITHYQVLTCATTNNAGKCARMALSRKLGFEIIDDNELVDGGN